MRFLNLCRIGSLPILSVFLLNLINLCPFECQFISRFSSKGLKGNITFNLYGETGTELLVIEALIESDQSRWTIPGNKELDGGSVPVIFEWSLHTQSLEPSMLNTCSNDDLGPKVEGNPGKSLTENRPIVLNELNHWKIPLNKFLQENNVPSLGAAIWGKSIRLKLSQTHFENAQQNESQKQQMGAPSIESPKASTPNVSSIGISRPKLDLKPTASTSQPVKPVFAARPKPTLSNKPKIVSPPSPTKPRAVIRKKRDSEISTKSNIMTPLPTASNTTVKPPEKLTPRPQEIASVVHRRVLKLYSKSIVCANVVDVRNVKTAEAVFQSQVAGKVTIRGNEDGVTLLMVDLYHIRSKVTTRHDWRIMASDILDNRRNDEKCRYLQVVFDPNNIEDSGCRLNDTAKCRMGDLTKKHGQIQVAGQGKSSRTTLVDLNLPISPLEGSRTLFMVVYEVASKFSNNGVSPRLSPLSCAQIMATNPRKIEASFNMEGVRGSIKISQRHSTEPTTISYDLFGLEGNIKHQSIRELPVDAKRSTSYGSLCAQLGQVFNPTQVLDQVDEDHLLTTVDSYKIGNLTAKHGPLFVVDSEYEDHYMGEYMDLSLQLFGAYSVAERSVLIHKNNGDPWVCATLSYMDESITTAVATFNYPVVGTVIFQQIANDPHAETNVLVEVYNPNSDKSMSDGHNWLIHLKPAMADFYNWSRRCESSGEVYDPVLSSVGLSNEAYNRQCQSSMHNEPLRCRLGDISMKSGFRLSLPVSHLNRSRLAYTDLFLPLSGPYSILGRSVVIYDDNSPTQRGNRLACSTIRLIHPLKSSVKSWDSGPSIPSNVYGSVVFEQDTVAKSTRVKLDLNGFNGNVEHYAIHNVWTSDDREFPCSNDSLYDVYDPFEIEKNQKLSPSAHYGSLATMDRVRVGDLSRKHGTFEALQGVQKQYIDTNAPLFAPYSIIGRSFVLRASVNDFRWVCGNIELEYDKSSSREIIGIASFDDPRNRISGYVRFTQLEHKDGSLSDTYVQVDLRTQSDGIHEPQTSSNHNWAIFVNQVGEDAYISADEVRCIAAGFKWNPFFAQDNQDKYSLSCGPLEPLGCAMGDLGMRHGMLTLGPNNRRVFSDRNLPLAGNFSVMGRSLVIFDNKKTVNKLACANIYPDIHLKSNVVIKRNPSFTVARFVEQMRSLLGAADWLMVPELRATKSVANGECVQMTIHFYGQRAHQLQVELNNLITLGTVRKSSRSGVEKISTHYKLCRTGQMHFTSSTLSNQRYQDYTYHVIILFISTLLIRTYILDTQQRRT